MSIWRVLSMVALMVINFAIGVYLWEMAGYLMQSLSPLKAVVGVLLYALVLTGAVLIAMTAYRDLTKKGGATDAKA